MASEKFKSGPDSPSIATPPAYPHRWLPPPLANTSGSPSVATPPGYPHRQLPPPLATERIPNLNWKRSNPRTFNVYKI
jgi:hypothetical protein